MNKKSSKQISAALIQHIVNSNPLMLYSADDLPLEKSLLELGVIDSYGVIELIEFIENNWNISINDEEITKEKMGSINKMCALIIEKLE